MYIAHVLYMRRFQHNLFCVFPARGSVFCIHRKSSIRQIIHSPIRIQFANEI